MLETVYTKGYLLARMPSINPHGWYATTFAREAREQFELRDNEIITRQNMYIKWYKKKHRIKKKTDIRVSYFLETQDKISATPDEGQFRFRDVPPKAFERLIKKFDKYKMKYVIIDTKYIKGEHYVTGYANSIA